ncbi:hypothetical protein BGZ83_004539 [Gryganskiella cystojenkinii]|nr:hypothetical protein BGZ83_004539 [Gryganskiella cystojenkinii]
MATGNDVREIFQLTKSSDQVKRVHKVEKKPDGISRELYGLIGNNVSTVAFNNPTYKPKLNLSTKAVNWTWRPFMNPSRDDDLILHHWEKTRTDPNEEYRFYKFNKAINLNEFTPEEYKTHLVDPDWTLEETNYLWDLCRRFDLRWVVIQDRYEWPPQEVDQMALQFYNGNLFVDKNGPAKASSTSEPTNILHAISTPTGTASSSSTPVTPATSTPSETPINKAQDSSSTAATPSTAVVPFTPAKSRTMEDLKNRYYTVNRTLIKIRMTDGSQAMEKAHLLSSMSYDKSREVERKKNLEILNTRTPEQIEEEEALYLEARRIDQNEKKISRERENLLRLLNTRDIYGPGGPASAGLTPGGSLSSGGPGSGIIIPSNNSITIPSSSPASNGANGPLSPSANKHAAAAAAAAASATSGGPVKKKKRPPKGSSQAEEAAAASAAASAAAAAAAAAAASSSSKGSSANRRLSNSSATEGSSSSLPLGVQVKKEKLTPGAYLRSQKMTPVVSTKQQRLSATLVQLGMPVKPAMPTVNVMAKWDHLQNNIVTLLDLKKQVDKLEADLKVVKMRRGSNSGLNLFPASSSLTATAGGSSAAGSGSALALSSTSGSLSSLPGSDGGQAVKREGTVDDGTSQGQVKKKKRKDVAVRTDLDESKKDDGREITTASQPYGVINFRDPRALRELTYCLLKRDFSIDLDIPLDSLCPTIPNRLNYICWIEDLVHNESERAISGIDIGTGASGIYPLLGCTRNKNWKMIATDINDRSISYATENVSRNKLQSVITILKNPSEKIFPDPLFDKPSTNYDFSMCNPPFYEDEQDIQESADAKADQPSAICQATSNEMITAGGEVQFVIRMVEESLVLKSKIQWYTSMVGKRSSLDSIVEHLKANKASMQQTSNKLAKLAAPRTTLSFQGSAGTTAEVAMERICALLDQIAVKHTFSSLSTSSPAESKSILVANVTGNTWSRAARRAMARAAQESQQGSASTSTAAPMEVSVVMTAEIRVSARTSPSSAIFGPTVEMTWTFGQDRDLFESFFLHLKTKFASDRK